MKIHSLLLCFVLLSIGCGSQEPAPKPEVSAGEEHLPSSVATVPTEALPESSSESPVEIQTE